MKENNLYNALIAVVFSLLAVQVNADESEKLTVSLEEISKFRKSGDDMILMNQLKLLKRDTSPPAETAKLLCGILIEVDVYLSTHQCPKEIPSVNIVPPGGGRSGVDPNSIVDPVERVAYEKLIDENKGLAEAHRKHLAVTRIRCSVLDLLAIHQLNGLVTKQVIEELIEQQAISKELKPRLLRQIETTMFNKAHDLKNGIQKAEKLND
jgi:hypothetical protein